jgi:hypothetical protein
MLAERCAEGTPRSALAGSFTLTVGDLIWPRRFIRFEVNDAKFAHSWA